MQILTKNIYNLENYIRFCKRFHKINLPEIRFRKLNQRYRFLYNNLFQIDEIDVNKATFFVFLFTFICCIGFLITFTFFNLINIMSYSLIFSLIISYKFNLILYKEIKSRESIINALLYLIKIDFSLIVNSLKSNSDFCMNFIELIKDYNLPISNIFKEIFSKIHEGKVPEKEIIKIITPSEDFDKYIQELIINNFNPSFYYDNFEDGNTEKHFKIYLKDIESKISIIFFIGLFFPIGLCFLILFQTLKVILIILFIPIFLLFLNFLFKKFIKSDVLLIGLLNNSSNIEKRKFTEFLFFLKSFALNLKKNISPEKAFYNSYLESRNNLHFLKEIIEIKISHLIDSSYSFDKMIHTLGVELNSIRYNLIINTIRKIISENAYHASEKINDILKIIHKHQKLEKKLEIRIRGEKFKLYLFLFLLPIIVGAIGGMLPLFKIITENLSISTNYSFIQQVNLDYINILNIFEFSIIFTTLLSSISITSYYFLKIIAYEKKAILIFSVDLLFTLTFFLSYTNLFLFI